MVATILSSLDADKAIDVQDIDLIGKTTIADRMIVASGTSARMVSAMGQHIMTKLKALGLKPRSEGEQQGDWVLVDAGDVIVHLFRPEVRAFYGIERIWAATSVPDKPGKVVKKAAKPRAKSAPKSTPRKKAAPARTTTRRA